MQDNVLILLFLIGLLICVLAIFLINKSINKNRELKNLIINSIDYQTIKKKEKVSYEDIRKAGDSLSGIVSIFK